MRKNNNGYWTHNWDAISILTCALDYPWFCTHGVHICFFENRTVQTIIYRLLFLNSKTPASDRIFLGDTGNRWKCLCVHLRYLVPMLCLKLLIYFFMYIYIYMRERCKVKWLVQKDNYNNNRTRGAARGGANKNGCSNQRRHTPGRDEKDPQH